MTINRKLKQIKTVMMDVDGVLTDGTFWWDAGDAELKRFCFSDRTGIPLAQKAGIKIALLSGESSDNGMAIVSRYAKKLNIDDVYKGCQDKAKAVREYAAKSGFALSEICFIGDDINDLAALKLVGFSVAPHDAHPSVLKNVDLVTKNSGGHGAVREFLDLLLAVKSKK